MHSTFPLDASVLVSSWSDGLFAISRSGRAHELTGRRVAGLASDGRSGALAVVDGASLMRRSPEGEWSHVATSDIRMDCCLAVEDAVYAGTVGAHLLRIRRDTVERVEAFDRVDGRTTWFAGSAVVDGKVVGPPLGVRSMTGSDDGRLLLAGVHVGGIARSADGGSSWHPTIDIDWDVHEVRMHPRDPMIAIAAAAAGLLVSGDGGATWTLERPGSEEFYCSAVAFSGDDLLVSVSSDHFARHGTLCRRPIDTAGSLEVAGGGLPDRLDGIVDTGCIASNGYHSAVVDNGGNVYGSGDGGLCWTRVAEGIPDPSSALVLHDEGSGGPRGRQHLGR